MVILSATYGFGMFRIVLDRFSFSNKTKRTQKQTQIKRPVVQKIIRNIGLSFIILVAYHISQCSREICNLFFDCFMAFISN